jgi:hypothetical protein
MKRLWFSLILIGSLLAACGSPGASIVTQPASTPTSVLPPPSPTHIPVDLSPAQRAALQQLAKSLNAPVEQIKLLSTEAVEWPDGCLGVARPGVMCAQVITPGFRILLEADGKQYEYHTTTDGSVVLPAAEDSLAAETTAVQSLAAMLGLRPDVINVISVTRTEWPDACLGIAQPGLVCAQVITPGFLIVLEADGAQYEYHTNQDASVVRSATLLLTWHREGGIAGFCDDLVVYVSGEVQASQCRPNGLTATGNLQKLLSETGLAEFNGWLSEFGTVTITMEDPAVADQMKVTLTLSGHGARQPSAEERQQLVNWAQNLYNRVKPG